MKHLLLSLIIPFLLAFDFNYKGYFNLTGFPINDEHGIYAQAELYQQIGYKNVYVFTNPRLCFTNEISNTTRTDHTYLTSWEPFNRSYFDEWTSGIGYSFNKNIDLRYVYIAHRLPDGYEGDWSGIQIHVQWGDNNE